MSITEDILDFDGNVLCSITYIAKDNDGNILTKKEIEELDKEKPSGLELEIEYKDDRKRKRKYYHK